MAGLKGNKVLPLLENYANAVGLGFQINDDILDVTGETHVLGKSHGVDDKNKINTYPSLIGFEKTQQKALNLYKQALNTLSMLEQQDGLNTETLQKVTNFMMERKN